MESGHKYSQYGIHLHENLKNKLILKTSPPWASCQGIVSSLVIFAVFASSLEPSASSTLQTACPLPSAQTHSFSFP